MGKLDWASKNLNDDEKLEFARLSVGSIFTDDTGDGVELAHVAEFEDEAQELVKKWGTFQGLSTGVQAIDNLTKGFVEGELIIVAGETSHGKTLVAVNMAVGLAERGHTVLFVTLEMTHAQLTARVIKTTDKELTELPILFQRQDELNWKDIDSLISQAKENGAECIFIDHLHYFTRELEKVSEDLGRITKEFKKNAIRHKLPIVLISHVRKKAPGNKNVEGSNDALRGSSYIAQDSDIVLFVRREDATNTQISVTKNRNRGFNPEWDRYTVEILDGAKISRQRSIGTDGKDIIAEAKEVFHNSE